MRHGSTTTLCTNGLASCWNLQIARAEKVFNTFSDGGFYKPVAPGKNRIIQLYGHLATYHDALKETLGLGNRSKPEYAALLLQNPGDPEATYPTVAGLKAYWQTIHHELSGLFATLPAADWFQRHYAMTDEDFAKDPARNRLSVLLNWANHVAYHIGRVNLVKF